jgi:hypothetical protein
MGQAANSSFKRELQALVTLRDELKLKAHLAKADVKDELNRLEAKWEHVEEELRRTASHAKEPIETIGQKTVELINELKLGYENLRRMTQRS